MRWNQRWHEIVAGVLSVFGVVMVVQLVELRLALHELREGQALQSQLLSQIGETLVCGAEGLREPLPAPEESTKGVWERVNP
jgi:hypothetical protein